MGKPRTRGNGLGSVYKRKDRNTWTVQIVTGWRLSKNKLIPIKKTIGGFKKKSDALEALNKLIKGEEVVEKNLSLDDVFHKWKTFYTSRVAPKTLKGYEQAYAHFASLKYRKIHTITAGELQKCMDDCPAGKRTHQLMKVTAGLIWGYAFDTNLVYKDITNNLYIGKHESKPREPLTSDDIDLIRGAIGRLRYAEYIYCLCYLGYRPGEFLEIKKDQVQQETIDNEVVYYIVEGIKTEAGKNRRVIVPKQIIDYVLDRLWVPGTDYLFPFYYFHRTKKTLIEIRKMTTNYFEDSVFKPIMESLGITGKVPYSTRHTYADKLKHADGDDRDKAALIGHADYNFTRAQYQSSPLEDLKAVTDTIK